MINVEVIYATKDEQYIFSLSVVSECTIELAIINSGVLEKYSYLTIEELKVGVFGQLKSLSDVLTDGDRVEIYRPLIADPKEIRRAKANIQKENNQFL